MRWALARTDVLTRAQFVTMQWLSWQYPTSAGFTLRGWHTPPTGKPLLHFLHGNGFCGRMYEPMLNTLAQHMDVWLCDLQGHGDSDHGGPFQGWNRNADLALEAFEAHAPRFGHVPTLAMGHSFGGVLTALILAQHPGRFERAVLLDPVLFPPMMLMGMSMAEMTGMARHTPLARQARGRRAHWPTRQEALEGLRGRGVYKGWSDEGLQAFVTHALRDSDDGGVALKCSPEREAEIFSSGPERLWHHLGRVLTPTLVLHAQQSFPFITESVQRWDATNPHIETREVPGGHCFMQEAPADSAALVRPFLLP